ncbi:MAG TPA: rhodanese-like domain-containing protein [Myxococcales bacterium]|nr:rhodanese-like domain-containing protein [Myxococcales bacterium]HIL01694.1 rhodanese-like domain-containing protein [Myxococcales bacterium]
MNRTHFVARGPRNSSIRLIVLFAGGLTLAFASLGGCTSAENSGVRSVPQEEIVHGLSLGRTPILLDVRSREEFAGGHLPGAVLIPVDELPGRLEELRQLGAEREIVVYCESGRRALRAAEALVSEGFGRVGHLEGDMSGWRTSGLPVKR